MRRGAGQKGGWAEGALAGFERDRNGIARARSPGLTINVFTLETCACSRYKSSLEHPLSIPSSIPSGIPSGVPSASLLDK